MKIWVFSSGEPLPFKDGQTRLLRSANLCRYLHGKGHDVVWWTSTYDHFKRRQITREDILGSTDGYELRAVYSPGYKRNVGPGRLLDHLILGIQFWRHSRRRTDKPDIIWCAYPPIEAAVAAVAIGRRLNVPIVVDVRDLWPDVFLDVFSLRMKRLATALLYPYFSASKWALMRCDALVGVTEGYLGWALRRSNRPRRDVDRVIPMGYPDFEISRSSLEDATLFWRSQGISDSTFNICFFGTLGRQFDIDTVIESARILLNHRIDIKVIICGHGSELQAYRKRVADVPNIIFPGWVDLPKIKTLMDLSALGLAPYRDTKNFQLNVPNKIFEYAAGALPVLSGVDGEVGAFLREHGIGHTYRSGDIQGLASAILKLASDPELLKEQGCRARCLFVSRFDAKIVSASIEALMSELTAASADHLPLSSSAAQV